MELSWAQVRARRLARHGLAAGTGHATPAAAVAAVAGMHAQVASAAELAVARRMAGEPTRQAVRTALAERSLLKVFGPRGTVHLVPADEAAAWFAALEAVPTTGPDFGPGVQLDAGQERAVLAAVAEALGDGDALTADELGEGVVARTGAWAAEEVMPAFGGFWPRWRTVLHVAGRTGILCLGAPRGRRTTYASPAALLGRPLDRVAPGAAVDALLEGYLRAYGPATPERFAHWLSTADAWARETFAARRERLEPATVAGEDAWVAAGDTAVPAADPAGVHLLGYFDPYAYRVGNQPPALLYPGRAAERALKANLMLVLRDGEVAGVWHVRRSGRRLAITVELLVRSSRALRAAVEADADLVAHVLEGRAEVTFGPVTVGGHA